MEEKKELSFEEVNDIRKLIVDAVTNIDSASGKRLKLSNLDCSKKLLNRIIFDYYKNCEYMPYKYFYNKFERKEITEKLDFDGVDFSDFNCIGFDFGDVKGIGISINPQTIYKKDLSNAICQGVKFIGLFDGVDISGANFTGSKGAKINPQTIYKKNLRGTRCTDVEFIGPFDRIMISGADFTGSKGAMIDPQTIYDKNLLRTVCTDVEFTGSFDNVRMNDETLLEGSNARYIDSYERVKESIKKLIK